MKNNNKKEKQMKKLMIALTAAAMAVGAQAAKITWTAMDVTDGKSSSYYAYLLDATSYSTVDAAVAAVVKGGTDTSGLIYSQALVYNSTKKIAALAAANKTSLIDYDAGASVNYWSLIFNASDASSATKYISTTGTTAGAGQFSAAGLLSIAQGSQASATWSATTVPEPTSGLLLLLGMAGLALKRKIA